MGKNIVKSWEIASQVFTEANEVLRFDLTKLCFTGPQTQLTATEYAQPAILTTSVAILRVLQTLGMKPDIVAGHSVGSFAALVAAECLSFADALCIVQRRGQLMAAVRQHGSMLAVVSASQELRLEVEALAAQHPALDVAGYNSPNQTVFSGPVEAIQQFQVVLAAFSGVKFRPFAVSHAFHSRLMEEQKLAWADTLANYTLAPARVPVGLNVAGEYTTLPDLLRADLIEQFTSPVQWRKLFQYLCDQSVETLLEVGMGRTLTGLARAWPAKPVVQETASVEALRRLSQTLQKERIVSSVA
jgi:[acyl-carrier-protein] S-malonyltransferase